MVSYITVSKEAWRALKQMLRRISALEKEELEGG